jgi:hypothetical protein
VLIAGRPAVDAGAEFEQQLLEGQVGGVEFEDAGEDALFVSPVPGVVRLPPE